MFSRDRVIADNSAAPGVGSAGWAMSIPHPHGSPVGAKANTGLFQGLSPGQAFVDAAFVQWADISAGIAHSFFDFCTRNYEIATSTVGASDQPLDV